MLDIKSKIESLLYISTKPIKAKKLAKFFEVEEEIILAQLVELKEDYDLRSGGIILVEHEGAYKLATNPDNAGFIEEYIKDEINVELTKPALETLTIIAYRGPISKWELELIRGVNCSMILRNLLIKGLVKTIKDKETTQEKYEVTMDFIKFLGISNIKDLPDYEKLSSHDIIDKLLGDNGGA